MKLGYIVIFFILGILNAFSATFNESSVCKTKLFTSQDTRRIAVVTHGFNNLPSEMSSIVRDLNQNHITVVLVCLKGHGLDDPEFKDVTSELWIQDVENAIEFALRTSNQISISNSKFSIPIDFVGFSLGALVFENVSSKLKSIVNKRIYLSPAFKLKIKNTDPLKKIDNSYWLPSFTPSKYRANRKTRFAAYKSLFELTELFEKTVLQNRSTLVFMNPKDEMINVPEIKNIILNQQLTSWNMVEVIRSQDSRYKINHLIVDEQALGVESYKNMMARIIHFLDY